MTPSPSEIDNAIRSPEYVGSEVETEDARNRMRLVFKQVSRKCGHIIGILADPSPEGLTLHPIIPGFERHGVLAGTDFTRKCPLELIGTEAKVTWPGRIGQRAYDYRFIKDETAPSLFNKSLREGNRSQKGIVVILEYEMSWSKFFELIEKRNIVLAWEALRRAGGLP